MARHAAHHHLIRRAGHRHQRIAGQVSHRLASGSSRARLWSKTAISRLVPSVTVPASGAISAGQQLQQRGLADAVRPDKGHPVAAQHAQRRNRGRSPCRHRLLVSPSASITLARKRAAFQAKAAVPCRRICAARSARIACRARTRPMLRLRRALKYPRPPNAPRP
jgi:hypothetical protein